MPAVTPSSSDRPFTVLVEGNIGSGKSTFLEHFNKFQDEVSLLVNFCNPGWVVVCWILCSNQRWMYSRSRCPSGKMWRATTFCNWCTTTPRGGVWPFRATYRKDDWVMVYTGFLLLDHDFYFWFVACGASTAQAYKPLTIFGGSGFAKVQKV